MTLISSPPSTSSIANQPATERYRWADFNIDTHLLRLLPHSSILPFLPRVISHFLGHRVPSPHAHKPPPPPPDMVLWTLSATGAFLGISAVTGIAHLLSLSPHVVGSMGAAAILLFLTPLSPLAQPRNLLLSQMFASVIGVGVGRLVTGWAAPGIAVAATAVVMCVTKTVHPPAGATAVLAVVDGRWRFVGVVMASTGVMAGVAMGWVNFCGLWGWEGGRWPERWFWGEGVGVGEVRVGVGEKGDGEEWRDGEEVVVRREGIVLPVWLELGVEEREVLEGIWGRVRDRRIRV
ncbi:HPP family-domain-containing protein [Trichophaea hybrida]|nr:HPP family-domain-containing protein [Trichophaea hybrida]